MLEYMLEEEQVCLKKCEYVIQMPETVSNIRINAKSSSLYNAVLSECVRVQGPSEGCRSRPALSYPNCDCYVD